MAECGCHVFEKVPIERATQLGVALCPRHSEAHIAALEVQVLSLETQAAGRERQVTALTLERDVLEKSFAMAEVSEQRAQQERDRLRQYVVHHVACQRLQPWSGDPQSCPCTCGLEAALTTSEVPLWRPSKKAVEAAMLSYKGKFFVKHGYPKYIEVVRKIMRRALLSGWTVDHRTSPTTDRRRAAKGGTP
mgnify:CR=1 FL=1